MKKSTIAAAAAWWIFSANLLAFGETRKAGLWEISTTTTWQKTTGTQGGFVDPAAGGTRTREVCLTQEMIDKWGALLPQSRGQCHIEDKVMHPGGSTASWVCSGRMKGKGELDTQWIDMEHSTGTLHFTGTIQVGSEVKPVEWTTTSTSSFKSADCGSVKPEALPQRLSGSAAPQPSSSQAAAHN